MQRILLILGFCVTILGPSLAQGVVQGMIRDANKEPIIGATVLIVGTDLGTVSDVDGSYRLENVPAGTVTLEYSYVGFKKETRQAQVASGATVTVDMTLASDATILEEVVVVGYGVQRKRDVVGNVGQLKSEKLNDFAGGSFENAIQGKVAGIQVTQTTGAAGAGSIIRFRGPSSITAGGDPLIVVDGIPLVSNNYLLGENGGQNNNPLNSINPADIASIEFLKDASSAAIYGARGGNGVVLITTKRGKKGKPQFSYSTKFGIGEPTRRLRVLNSDEWMQIQQEAWENDGRAGRFDLKSNVKGLDYSDIQGINTDWLSQVIQTAFKQEHNLSYAQGGNKTNTFVGLSYSNAESYLVGNSFERASLRVNFDYNPTRRIKLGVSTSLAGANNKKVPQAWAGGFGLAQSNALPIFPIYNNQFPTTSSFYKESGYYNVGQNPVAQLDLQQWRVRELRSISNLNLSYVAAKNWTWTFQGSVDFSQLGEFIHTEAELRQEANDLSRAQGFRQLNWNTFLTTQYEIPMHNENHNLRIMGGVEAQKYSLKNSVVVNFEGLTDLVYKVDSANNIYKDAEYFPNEVEGFIFNSFFSRLNYAFKDKFLAQVVFRTDASSKFGQNKRFGYFPSVGLGYIMSDEKWFNRSVVNYLKLKTSWGITGNASIPRDQQYATYAFPLDPNTIEYGSYYNSLESKYQKKLANPNLGWENIRTLDCGFDAGFFDDKVTLGASYYNRLTYDALLLVALQASTGFENLNYYSNVGKIVNRGFEINLGTRVKLGKVLWSADFNVTRNQNEVLEVGTATPDALDGGFGDIRVVKGYPVGVNYIVRFDHVDPETGRPVYLDAQGKQTSVYDVGTNRVPAGTIQPDAFGGLNNSFSYKNWDLSFLFNFVTGNNVYDDAAKRQLGVVTPDWNFRPEIFDRWRKPGDVAKFPKLSGTMLNWGGNDNAWQNNHTLWLEDASFLRLRNVTLGYNVQFKESRFRSMRVYVTGANLLTFTKYSGWDPEVARDRTSEQQRNVGGTNVTYLTAPQERSYVLGINLDF